jgi:hypothetical protein
MIHTNRSSWLVAAAMMLALASFGFAGSDCCSKGGGSKNDAGTTTAQCDAKAKHECSADCKAKGCGGAKGQAKGGDCKHGDAGTTGSAGCGNKL